MVKTFVLVALVACSSVSAFNPSDSSDLKQAAAQALRNLKSYQPTNNDGTWPQSATAWWQSATAYSAFLDYQRWTGDTQFASFVADGLTKMSPDGDFINSGSANDDILWGAQAYIAGSEMAGWSTKVPAKTLSQTLAQEDNACGANLIYWQRDRAQNNYKSVITNVEWLQVAARTYMLTHDSSLITNANQIISGLKSSLWKTDGTLNDGLEAKACGQVTTLQWSYSYGELIGALAFLNKATGDAQHLSDASTVLNKAVSLFAPSSVLRELCEPTGCNRDQRVFKGIFARNLAYLYRQTSNSADKATIARVIDSSVQAMAAKSCDSNRNCNSLWVTGGAPIRDVQAQQVAATLLVSALGVHSTNGGTGLYTAPQKKKKRKSKKSGPKRQKDS